MRRCCLSLACVAILTSAGCAVRKPLFPTYRLIKQDVGQVLIPPGVVGPDVNQRTVATDVSRGSGACPSIAGPIGIQVRKRRVQVTVNRATLASQPHGWLREWADELEAQGCVKKGDGLALADQVVQSVPLDTNTAFQLRYSSEIDIGAQARIQVVSPILREGVPQDAPTLETQQTAADGNRITLSVRSTSNLLGYETAWYEVRPKVDRVGFTIAPLYADRSVDGKNERRPQPATGYLKFPASAAFYRLFYEAQRTEFTGLMIAASSTAELESQTKLLENGSTASCEMLGGAPCVAFPKLVAVNVFFPIQANGSEHLVRWGATLGEAIRSTGE